MDDADFIAPGTLIAGYRSEAVVVAEAVWAIIECGLLPKTPETIRNVAAAARIEIDDLRRASESVYRGSVRRRYAPNDTRQDDDEPDQQGELERGPVPARGAAAADFVERLRRHVDEADPQMPAAVLAERVLEDLDQKQANEVASWLQAMATEVLEQEIKRIRRLAGPPTSPKRTAARSFAQRAARFELAGSNTSLVLLSPTRRAICRCSAASISDVVPIAWNPLATASWSEPVMSPRNFGSPSTM